MKQHIKQPNYFGLTSSICSVASGLQWFADRSATGLQSVCNYCRLVCMVCKYALSMIAKTTLQSLYLFPSSKLLEWFVIFFFPLIIYFVEDTSKVSSLFDH